jgi:hypothetical protein
LFLCAVVAAGNDSALIELIIRQHVTLQSLSPTLAEVYYILEAQKLDGYGVDFFPAKTDAGVDCFVGSSLLGIILRYASLHATRLSRSSSFKQSFMLFSFISCFCSMSWKLGRVCLLHVIVLPP